MPGRSGRTAACRFASVEHDDESGVAGRPTGGAGRPVPVGRGRERTPVPVGRGRDRTPVPVGRGSAGKVVTSSPCGAGNPKETPARQERITAARFMILVMWR